jgi:hypothetical protein
MSSVVAVRTTSRSQERLKAYRRANKAVIARIEEKKITDLAILVLPQPLDPVGI